VGFFEPETIKNVQTSSRQYSFIASPQRFKAELKTGVKTEFILLRVGTVASSRERRKAPGKRLCCMDLAAEMKHSFRHGFYDWLEQFLGLYSWMADYSKRLVDFFALLFSTYIRVLLPHSLLCTC
jgi:hypothetical protein